ncbi:hypothetical protein RJ639_039283 [Escallonia herrerae]|uniref:Uncharacterized protein n=1 Tax=Escallonia herrerae TaxID=1293975 RepID=A0AA89B7F0_9ASTE|nr:hypothetical protein RJ639_039283 [Escallonia herrerae]
MAWWKGSTLRRTLAAARQARFMAERRAFSFDGEWYPAPTCTATKNLLGSSSAPPRSAIDTAFPMNSSVSFLSLHWSTEGYQEYRPAAIRGSAVNWRRRGKERIEVMSRRSWRKDAVQEVKTQLCLAGPLFSVALLQFSIQAISVMFVGHLGELALSGASMATSFATMGMASALDTLCGQSFGAEQQHMLGLHAQRAALVLLPVSALLAIIWGNTKTILISIRQDPKISEEAGIYACFMIPSIFAYALLQCLVKFLQAQRIVFSYGHNFWNNSSSACCCIRGAALASSLSYWINVLLLVAYVKFFSSCKRTWNGFLREAFHNVIPILKFSVPSALMLWREFWRVILVSWNASILGIVLYVHEGTDKTFFYSSFNIFSMIWRISYGLGAAVSTRVSTELGSNKPQAAQLASWAVLFMSITEGVIVGTILILLHNLLGHLYSNEK